jgi:hypothetical protein
MIDQIGDLAQRLVEERIRGPRRLEEEPAAPESVSRDRRRISMPRRVVRATRDRVDTDPAKRTYGDPIFTWAFPSSKPYGGTIVTHETRLEQDGELRCGCLGWCIEKKDKITGLPKPRECKHTKLVAAEAPGILRRWRNGETLEILNPLAAVGTTSGRMSSRSANVSNPPRSEREAAPTDTRIRHGRVIEI